MSKMHLIGWTAVWLILSLLLIGLLWTPKKAVYYHIDEKAIVDEFEINDVIGSANCEVDSSGNVKITGTDAQVLFRECDTVGNTVVLKFAQPIKKAIGAQLYYATEQEEFNESNSTVGVALQGYDTLCMFLPEQIHISRMRLDIDTPYQMEKLQILNETPQQSYDYQVRSDWNIVWAILGATILLGIFICVDKKTKIISFFFDFLRCEKKKIAIVIGCICFVILISCGISAIIYKNGIHWPLAFFICGVIGCLVVMICGYGKMAKEPEKVFAGLILTIGMTMILGAPFSANSWDVNVHFRFATEASFIGDGSYSQAQGQVMINGEHFFYAPSSYEEMQQKIATINDLHSYDKNATIWSFHLAHIPFGIAIAILRLFNSSFYVLYTLGKIPALLIYTATCYYGMKRLHSGKMILAVVAMFPTNLFLACNYSYDYWVTGFSILGVAYFVGMCQEKEKNVKWKDMIIMCVAFLLACYPKEIYLGFLLLPFFMKTSKLQNKKKYFQVCIGTLILMVFLLGIRTVTEIGGGGDARGGSGVNPVGQLRYILHYPIQFLKIIFDFLKNYLSIDTLTQSIGNFAYLGICGGSGLIIVILLIVALTDRQECDKKAFSYLARGYALVLYIGTTILIATAMYIAYTPVATQGIAGCQPRYLLPLIYPLVAIVPGGGIRVKMPRAIYNGCIFFLMSAVLLGIIYSQMTAVIL